MLLAPSMTFTFPLHCLRPLQQALPLGRHNWLLELPFQNLSTRKALLAQSSLPLLHLQMPQYYYQVPG